MGANISQTCKVSRCRENHLRHFCRLCKARDSDHFSSECPNGKTLYHGTQIKSIKPIAMQGFKNSPRGRLGPGIYFVDTLENAKRISYHRDPRLNQKNAIVFQCQVNLGRHIDLGHASGGYWQGAYDSASGIHPPWPGVNQDFKEYCLKYSKDCVVESIYINDYIIKKDENMTWGDAEQNVIRRLNSHFEELQLLMNQLNKKKTHFTRLLRRNMSNFKASRPDISCKWFLSRWYVIVKALLMLFFMVNGIWSIAHLNKQDKRNNTAIVFFVIFFCLQSIANFIFIAVHGIESLDKPHKINSMITLLKFVISFFLEMPMLVSQAYAIQISIRQNDSVWSSFIGDICLQFQFVFNLMLLLSIDFVYHGFNRYFVDNQYLKLAFWIPGVILLSMLIAAFAFTPIHLAQLGWNGLPTLTDFGGRFGNNGNVKNLLRFLMYTGTVGLWTWPVTSLIFCMLALQKMFSFKLEAVYKRWYLLVKAFLILFNIWNGIYSLQHLYSKSNSDYENIRKALISFACFFTFQAIVNLIYLFCHEVCASHSDHSLPEMWKTLPVLKLLIAFVFEMPMLTSQAYVMRHMENLVWSELNWDFAMQLQFIINLTTFLSIDDMLGKLELLNRCDLKEGCLVSSRLVIMQVPLLIICGVFLAPVYVVQVGWEWTPNSLDVYGGVIGPARSNGINGLMYISMFIGLIGLWVWTLVLGAIAIAILYWIFRKERKHEYEFF